MASSIVWPDVALLVSKDWEAVGIKTIVQIRERALHFKMNENNELMAEIWNEDTSAFPYTGNAKVDPRNAPILTMGPLWRRWYATGGKDGVEPSPEMKRIVEIVNTARTVPPEEQVKLSQELYRIWAENCFEIGTPGHEHPKSACIAHRRGKTRPNRPAHRRLNDR